MLQLFLRPPKALKILSMDALFRDNTHEHTHDCYIRYPGFPWSKSEEHFFDQILNKIHECMNNGVLITIDFMTDRDKFKKSSTLLQ